MSSPANQDSPENSPPRSPATSSEETAFEIVHNYLNSQLAENHTTATKWLGLYGGDNKDFEERNLYAWAKYRCEDPEEPNTVTEFLFSKPSLTPICGHAVLLHIKIDSMHTIRGGATTLMKEMSGKTVSYYVAVTYGPIMCKCEEGISQAHTSTRGIGILCCDFDHAEKVIIPTDDDSTSWRKVKDYLIQYLKVLRKGKHHILSYPLIHSPLSPCSSPLFELDNIFGCTAEMINGYLSLLWHISTLAFFAPRMKAESRTSSWLATRCSFSLSPDSNPSGRHVSLTFGVPTKVTLLCAREVILHFSLTEVRFYDGMPKDSGDEREPKYQNLNVKLVVSISGDHTTGIRIKRGTARRMQMEFFPKNDSDFELLMKFFVERYFEVMAATLMDFIFYKATAIIPKEPPQVPTGTYKIEDTTMEGFDVVIAVSQTCINNQILRVLEMDDSTRWVKQEADFDIEIKMITVHLLDSTETVTGEAETSDSIGMSQAIITIHGTRATLEKTLKLQVTDKQKMTINDKRTIRNWQLAFEVDIVDCDHQELLEDLDRLKTLELEPRKDSARPSRDRLTGGGNAPAQTASTADSYELRHIYLDLKNARFAPKYSPWPTGNQQNIDALTTLVDHIKTHYFPRLLAREMHVIASVPIYKDTAATGSFQRLTRMSYRTFAPKATQTGKVLEGAGNAKESGMRSEQILFVLGMVCGNPSPPISSFKPSALWLDCGRFSHGALAISRHAFLSTLLPLLAHVNALTTFIPIARDNSGEASKVIFEQWKERCDHQGQLCAWTTSNNNHPNEFEWNWTRQWCAQEHNGSPPLMTTEDHISSETHNKLELRATSVRSNDPLEIRMSGDIELNLSSKLHAWEVKTSLHWEADIIINTSTAGGSVEVEIQKLSCTPDPIKTIGKTDGVNIPNVLSNDLLQKEDLYDVLRKLEGDWGRYYPASSKFTRSTRMSNGQGDILFELQHSPLGDM